MNGLRHSGQRVKPNGLRNEQEFMKTVKNRDIKGNRLYGNAGNDTLNGGAGSDLLVGGKGSDTYVIDSPIAGEQGATDTIIDVDGLGSLQFHGATHTSAVFKHAVVHITLPTLRKTARRSAQYSCASSSKSSRRSAWILRRGNLNASANAKELVCAA
jgi:hypothetical protein